MTTRPIAIVGAGEAGTRAAIALRDHGYGGPLILIGEELHPPYERPPLSKAALTAEAEPSPSAIADAYRLADLRVERLAGARVTAIDRAEHRLVTSEHGGIDYERLLLATGARARQLRAPGGEHAILLRTYDEALALRRLLRPGARVVVVGGGFIGLELAASARERGASVVVLEAAPRILTRGVPADIAEKIAARHRRAGVEIVAGCAISYIARDGGAFSVALSDGRIFAADCVIAGVGAAPEVELAAAAGLAIDNGIAVNGRLQSSDPDIFAAGDCCSFPHALYDGRRVRLEAWRNAQDQGAFVARALIGASEDYAVTPWFWSDQYDLHLQISGLVDAGATVISRDLGEGAVLNFHLAEDGRLVAASAFGPIGKIAKDARVAEMLIAKRAKPDPAYLAAGERKLKALLAA
ncbi:MAG TPA: FAD-dependent oxidoreductase [Roseiarcus sp.]|nr:FAD-dependent oxidoreductase [Roseiarcus sp.]